MTSDLQQYNNHLMRLLSHRLQHRPDRHTDLANWQSKGLPHRRLEAWKYTTDFSWVPSVTQLNLAKPIWNEELKNKLTEISVGFNFHLVFLDGHYMPETSHLPPTCQVVQLKNDQAAMLDTNNPFISFNQLISQETTEIRFNSDHKTTDELLILHFCSEASAKHYVNYQWTITLAARAQVKVVEVSMQEDLQAATNGLVKLQLKENSQLDYSRMHLARPQNIAHNFIHVSVAAKAKFNFNYIGTGAKQVRQELLCDIIGEFAEIKANGLYDVRGDEHHDFNCNFYHLVANTQGNYFFKGALRDKAHAVFTCNIEIAHQAQKTNAELLNKNLLLGERSRIDTRPQLQVFADDVKAGHGATVGRISDDELFYLQSRGIDRHRAFELLSQGFVDDVFQRLPESQHLWMLNLWKKWRGEKLL